MSNTSTEAPVQGYSIAANLRDGFGDSTIVGHDTAIAGKPDVPIDPSTVGSNGSD